jgi:group I intron endonuclease
MTGIYCITNKVNNKKYIGQTRHMQARKRYHFNVLGYGYHHNHHLQNAYKTYGKDNFVFTIVELVDDGISQSDLDAIEVDYIQAAYTANQEYGYNIEIGGRAGRKIDPNKTNKSGAKKGHPVSELTKERISAANKGRIYGPHSEESNAKRAASLKGRKRGPRDPELVKRIANSIRGKKYGPQSPEHLAKRIAALRAGIERRKLEAENNT